MTALPRAFRPVSRRARFDSHFTAKNTTLTDRMISLLTLLTKLEAAHQPPDTGHTPPDLRARTFAFGARRQIAQSMSEDTGKVIDPETRDQSKPVQQIVMLSEVLQQRPLQFDIKADR